MKVEGARVRILMLSLMICTAVFSCATIPAKKKEKRTVKTKVKPYCVQDQCYFPLPSAEGYVEEGYASWYGPEFHRKRTASGEPYDMNAMTAAHKTLPFGTYVKVTRLDSGKWVIVRINDRGPFVRGRIIDLSRRAAKELGMLNDGIAKVRIEAVQPATLIPYASLQPIWELQPVPSFRTGEFEIQVGAFLLRDNAERLRSRLKGSYDYVVIVPFECSGRIFYRVRVGLFKDLVEAEREAEKIRRRGFPDAFVIAREGA
ncbi:septal ring lytic transglycosylase RlpA family protein [Thermodesulforhabdus norvegica]|uniref:Probable endolytic peptidoglycan transglycosylase RlpA n=1 Tax=Thermodesulforhabdus norvegica TaxID=39841 RepID=A0A1I4TQ60_9BACT|nr:septal ring lytic transglycosylase RlpA family protein [Thermodesulforhabdus norvegica]SFM78805.1 rare lipoprotein A [Thermodesulforhabdus norvegica]